MARSGWKESGIEMFRWLVSSSLARWLPRCASLARAGADDPGRTSTWSTSSPPSRTRPASWSARCSKDDFEIYDNGVKQEIAVFERQTDQPLSVALMVDTSGSTAKDLEVRGRLRRASSCTRCWRRAIRRTASRSSASTTTSSRAGFTRNYAALERAARNCCSGEAGTSLYDAIYLRRAGAGKPRGAQSDRRHDRWRRHHQLARPARRR